METLEAIFTRRSIRKYIDKTVEEDKIDIIIDAAMSAPSAGNARPWHFVVIRERETLDKIPEFHHHAKMIKQAQLAIVVCGDPSLEKYKGRWTLDCSAATENLLLALHALGLAGVWVGLYPVEERMKGMAELLKVPENVIPFAVVPIGYSETKGEKADRFEKSKIHYDRW